MPAVTMPDGVVVDMPDDPTSEQVTRLKALQKPPPKVTEPIDHEKTPQQWSDVAPPYPSLVNGVDNVIKAAAWPGEKLGGKLGDAAIESGQKEGLSPNVNAARATVEDLGTQYLTGAGELKLANKAGSMLSKGLGRLRSGVSDFMHDLTGNASSEAAGGAKKALESQLTSSASTAEQGADIAGKAAAQQTGKIDRSVGNIPGVKTSEEFGKFKPVPDTGSQMGERIRSTSEKYLDGIRSSRDTKTKEILAQVMPEAKAKEAAGARLQDTEAYKKLTSDLQREIDVSPLDVKTGLKKMLDNIRDPNLTFKGFERGRRFLGDIAFGGKPPEGYEAIGKQAARNAYNGLSDAMKEFSPNFGEYLSTYSKMSEPLDVATTKLGKAFASTEGGLSKDAYHSVDASKLPDRVFSSPESYRTFVDSIGGNKQLGESIAKDWFAGKLEGKSAKQAEEFLTSAKSRDLLNELPGLKSQLETKFLKPLQASELIKNQAAKRSEIFTKNAESYRKEIRRIETEPDAKKALSGASGIVDKMLTDGAIDKAKATAMKQQLDQVSKEYGQHENAKWLAVKVASILGITGGMAYGGKKALDYIQ